MFLCRTVSENLFTYVRGFRKGDFKVGPNLAIYSNVFYARSARSDLINHMHRLNNVEHGPLILSKYAELARRNKNTHLNWISTNGLMEGFFLVLSGFLRHLCGLHFFNNRINNLAVYYRF